VAIGYAVQREAKKGGKAVHQIAERHLSKKK